MAMILHESAGLCVNVIVNINCEFTGLPKKLAHFCTS